MNAPRQEVLNIFQNNAESFNTQLQQLCDLLQRTLSHYTWVGFYFANADTRTLHLGPYCGAPTDHTSIPFGKGICGQVALSNDSFVVDDVQAEENYISCNIDVKSEVVIPLFLNKINIGQIDIDSNTPKAFNQTDTLLLEEINNRISNYMLYNKLSINIS